MAKDEEGLAAKLKRAELREASEAAPADLQQAMAAKMSLSDKVAAVGDPELLRDLLDSPDSEVVSELQFPRATQKGHAPSAGVAIDRSSVADLALAARTEMVGAAEGDKKRRGLTWLLGREEQEEGTGPITVVPLVPRRFDLVDEYDIEAPFSRVRILRDVSSREMLYQVIEPQITETEAEILEFVKDALVRGLDVDPSAFQESERQEHLLAAARKIILDYRIRISRRGQARVEYYLLRDLLGLGLIHVAMVDPNVEDISCDGPDIPVFIFHRKYESIPSTIMFTNEPLLDAFVIRMAQRSGRVISISEPMLDAAMPDGSRLQATLGQEVTHNGSTFTIRRFKPDPFTPIDLIRLGTMDVEIIAWFWMTVQAGQSLLFSGGTASGKTTGLNAISQFIPHQAKIVTIEDTREVNLPHENWIKSVTRTASVEGGPGDIGMFELLRASLRQRPEYILVGEVRGKEAAVAFQAMATGHHVFSTIHADSAKSVVYRLENEPINVPRLVLQALDIICIQIQTRVNGQRVRRLKEVVELVGLDPNTREILTNTVFRWDSDEDRFIKGSRSYLLEGIAAARNWSAKRLQEEVGLRKKIIQTLVDSGHKVTVEELANIVRTFVRDPTAALRMAEDL